MSVKNHNEIKMQPGVIASGFSGKKTGFLAWLRKHLLISEQAGAQAALIAATQRLPAGSYWHNVFGSIKFREQDPALDSRAATALWNELETLSVPFIHPDMKNKKA